MGEDSLNRTVKEYLPLRDIVFKTLRNAIITGELQPGERLMEKQLGEKLGVSRTPIREAIRKLELEGLVVMVQRKGAQVASFTEKDITDVLEVRMALEELAVKLACERMDQRGILKLQLAITEFEYAMKDLDVETMIQKDVEFHETIFNSTSNEKLIHIFNNLKEQIHRFRVAYMKNVKQVEEIHCEHKQIIEAIKSHNSNKAQLLAVQHIQNQQKAVVEFIRIKSSE